MLFKYINQIRQKQLIHREDIIKLIYKNASPLAAITISEKLEYGINKLNKRLDELVQSGAIVTSENGFVTTARGNDMGEKLVRAHRLWEKYLVDEVGLQDSQIHEDAENLEHLMDHEMINRLDERLGFPEKDPHGSPIPKKAERALSPLLNLKPKSRGIIAKDQINDKIDSELFELGLSALMPFQIVDIQEDGVVIHANGRKVNLGMELARKINIE